MPAPFKVVDEELLERLLTVFRTWGFEGASLSRLEEGSGLKRASLYHRYPGGKEEMARAALAYVHRRFVEHVLAPAGEDGDPSKRAREIAKRLKAFYAGGRQSCLLDTMALGGENSPLAEEVLAGARAVRDALASLSRAAGHSAAEARRRAEELLAMLEGALILARALGETAVFNRTLKGLPEQLTGD